MSAVPNKLFPNHEWGEGWHEMNEWKYEMIWREWNEKYKMLVGWNRVIKIWNSIALWQWCLICNINLLDGVYCLEQMWPKMIRDALCSHYATRNVTLQLSLALRNAPWLWYYSTRTPVALALSIGRCSRLGERQLVEIKTQWKRGWITLCGIRCLI